MISKNSEKRWTDRIKGKISCHPDWKNECRLPEGFRSVLCDRRTSGCSARVAHDDVKTAPVYDDNGDRQYSESKKNGARVSSGDNVRQQQIFQPRDFVFYRQFALFQPADANLIG